MFDPSAGALTALQVQDSKLQWQNEKTLCLLATHRAASVWRRGRRSCNYLFMHVRTDSGGEGVIVSQVFLGRLGGAVCSAFRPRVNEVTCSLTKQQTAGIHTQTPFRLCYNRRPCRTCAPPSLTCGVLCFGGTPAAVPAGNAEYF